MKHIKLPVILTACLTFSSVYLQSAQPTWWERSKNYAASWVPQAAQQKAKALRHVFLTRVLYRISYESSTNIIVSQLLKIMNIKYNNPNQNITKNIDQLIKFADAGPFDIELLIHDSFEILEKSLQHALEYAESHKLDTTNIQQQKVILNRLKKEIDTALADFIQKKSTKKQPTNTPGINQLLTPK